MSLTQFIGSELVVAVGRLASGQVLGPWRKQTPAGTRRRARFVPALYGDDHAHDHAELCLLLEGHCVFSLNHAAAVLRPGDLVICPAGHPHAEAFVRPAESYRLAWWSLNPEEPSLHVTRYARRGGFAMDHRMNLGTLPAEARARLEALRSLASAENPPALEPIREAMLTLTLALYRRALDGGEKQLDTRAQLVRRAVAHVKARAHEPLTLGSVARAVHVSPNYLTGLFKAETGVSLGRYILEERMARARTLLGRPGASVKAVALELGFTDPFTFSRAFKRVTGLPPSRALTAGA